MVSSSRLACTVVAAIVVFVGCSTDDEENAPAAGGTGGSSSSSSSGSTGGGGSSAGGNSAGGSSAGGGSACSAELLNSDSRLPSDMGQQLLDMHNAKRTQYCLEPMVWNCDLARVAQDYAELGAGNLPHNDDRHAQYAALANCGSACPQLGENIAWHQPYDYFPITTGMDDWLAEEDPQSCNDGGSHYTQIVWETATELGCGMWIDDNDGTKLHLVCNYIEFQLSGPAFPIDNCSGC